MLSSLIMWIVIGAIAGWLAGYIMTRNTALNMVDVILGMVGAVVGGYIAYNFLGMASNLVGNIIVATVGALLVAFIYKAVTGKSAQ